MDEVLTTARLELDMSLSVDSRRRGREFKRGPSPSMHHLISRINAGYRVFKVLSSASLRHRRYLSWFSPLRLGGSGF